MIRLETANLLTRWFAWSCDHLPATTGYLPPEKAGAESRAKTGAWYVENGTTLCHLFWATLWMPLLIAATAGFFGSMIVMIHFAAHADFVRSHPDSPFQAVSYFFPELFVTAFVLVFIICVLAVIGGSKTGFFSLLWQYVHGLKNRVCPLVKFEPKQL